MRPECEWCSGRVLAGVRGLHRRDDEPVVGGEVADRIGAGGVTCQLECLAATSAKIDLATIAASAWIGHPACPAKALEER
jgi:hypothetical protein